MAGTKDLDLDLEDQDKGSLAENRIKDLSSKVKSTSEERDAMAKAKEESDTRAAAASKEVEFYKGFATASSQYPNASEHTDEIKAKVLAGYTVEDATVSVLAKAGKLRQERQSPAGGSATNPPQSSGPKAIKDMSRDEKRAALMEAESRGEFSVE